jgi:hypothetical protein
MLSIFAIASARSPPMASADGSLNVRSSVVAAGAGEGVEGTFVAAVNEAGAGAAGAAGV